MQCEHYECRCARARELMAIADRTGQVRYLVEAIHLESVECRILKWDNRKSTEHHEPVGNMWARDATVIDGGWRPGPFARYAEKLLRIANQAGEDNIIWS